MDNRNDFKYFGYLVLSYLYFDKIKYICIIIYNIFYIVYYNNIKKKKNIMLEIFGIKRFVNFLNCRCE